MVPVLAGALSPDASLGVKCIGIVTSACALVNLIFYLNLYPPCEPDITSALGCTHLNWDPAVRVEFDRTVWMVLKFAYLLPSCLLLVAAGSLLLVCGPVLVRGQLVAERERERERDGQQEAPPD
jgi:hypothetical protein